MSNGSEKREHFYHAEAEVLTGNLQLPLLQEIKSQASARLPEKGGYLSQHELDYRLEGVIAFDRAYTQTSGNPGKKPGHGWTTLATSVVEGLNILDVVTADRVVGQIFIEHPLVGYVPEISFLGTRFENLRIAGHPVTLDLDLNHFGSKPENDAPYTKSPGFLDRVSRQHEQVRKHTNLLQELLQRYTGVSPTTREPEGVECSLVSQAGGGFPGDCHGHVIHIPHFGTLCLATVRLEQSDPTPGGTPQKTLLRLNMIEAHMGCVAEGRATVGGLTTNGMTKP
ncbi:MAG TPA: hypothetical protein VLZ50_06595 [Terracidiphilus sp.]|nr:hypothetical protein [Terracidiphilus sp.]